MGAVVVKWTMIVPWLLSGMNTGRLFTVPDAIVSVTEPFRIVMAPSAVLISMEDELGNMRSFTSYVEGDTWVIPAKPYPIRRKMNSRGSIFRSL